MNIRNIAMILSVCALPIMPVAADDEDHGSMKGASHELHEVMVESSKKAPQMKMSGDVDKDFAKMMADHHRSGIKMAQIQIESGKDPELKALAQKIVTSQKEELTKLEKHAEMNH